ncbi:transporter [Ganoderma sinense ZZ0214-1]|uniref:Transporter n=1 Tax=Ganoderma sinense ZZ0214-1 TaxID=1077348 RepID=A0A2G8RR64_9APHY|nr:transporter [Ganoderma sinense ZZ0214-1]
MTASQTVDTAVQLPAKHGVSPEGLRPVTIRQLLDATRQHSEAPFQISDVEAHRISLVAHVVSVRVSESSTTYELEDGTSRGRIFARRWSSDAACDDLPDDCSKLYVHIVGHLDRKAQLNGRNWVIIEQIHAVTDMPNRLFFHILETAFVTLSLERGPPPITAVPSNVEAHNATASSPTPVSRDAVPKTPRRVAGSSSQPQPSVPVHIRNSDPPTVSGTSRQPVPRAPAQETTSVPPIRQPAPTRQSVPAMSPSPSESPPPSSPSPRLSSPSPPRTPPPPQRAPKTFGKRRQPGVKRDPYGDLTVLQRAILLQLMNAPPSEHGTNVSTIAIAVSHHDVTSNQVGAALDELVDLGHIESTIDDSHYAVKTSHYPTSP